MKKLKAIVPNFLCIISSEKFNNKFIKMDLDKILIKLEKQGWKLEKDFLDKNQNFLQDLVDETEKAINYTRCCTEFARCKCGANVRVECESCMEGRILSGLES